MKSIRNRLALAAICRSRSASPSGSRQRRGEDEAQEDGRQLQQHEAGGRRVARRAGRGRRVRPRSLEHHAGPQVQGQGRHRGKRDDQGTGAVAGAAEDLSSSSARRTVAPTPAREPGDQSIGPLDARRRPRGRRSATRSTATCTRSRTRPCCSAFNEKSANSIESRVTKIARPLNVFYGVPMRRATGRSPGCSSSVNSGTSTFTGGGSDHGREAAQLALGFCFRFSFGFVALPGFSA